MITRREWLVGSAAAAALPLSLQLASAREPFNASSPLPHKGAFFPFEGTYFNSASQHPMSRAARQAADHYLDFKKFSAPGSYPFAEIRDRARSNYAKLINAEPDEICFVQSTTVGENLVLQALGIPGRPGRIVTDELHFIGSMPTYLELAKRGMDVVTLRASEDGVIDLEQYEQAINDDTLFVAVSLVSMLNGFQHDLKGLCEIAHAKGALVFADTVQAAGAVPIDARDSGVDFTSAAGYKWLMGDMGLGFLSVRRDRLDSLQRPWWGSGQLASREHRGFPNPGGDGAVSEYEYLDSALGYFAMGTQSNMVAAALDVSLEYLLEVGVEQIQAYRQPIIDHLQDELPPLGYAPITPRDAGSSIVSFRHNGDPGELRNRLQAAGVTITVSDHYFRVAVSVFNDMDDAERLVSALA
jgi:selenocysteine lyase/cysteine desulfurase